MFFSCNLSTLNQFECVLMNNQEWKVTSKIVNVYSNKPLFYLFSSIKTSKCSGSYNNINGPYERLCFLMLLKI